MYTIGEGVPGAFHIIGKWGTWCISYYTGGI